MSRLIYTNTYMPPENQEDDEDLVAQNEMQDMMSDFLDVVSDKSETTDKIRYEVIDKLRSLLAKKDTFIAY